MGSQGCLRLPEAETRRESLVPSLLTQDLDEELSSDNLLSY